VVWFCFTSFIFHDFASQEWSLGMFYLSMAPNTAFLQRRYWISAFYSSFQYTLYRYIPFFPFSSDKCTSILVICDWNRFSFSVIKDVNSPLDFRHQRSFCLYWIEFSYLFNFIYYLLSSSKLLWLSPPIL
jgi:hypothetical protein